MVAMIGTAAADDKVLPISGFDDIDHVGHADYSLIFLEHRIIADLEKLSLPNCFIHRISLQHVRHLYTQVKSKNIVNLNWKGLYIILCA